MVDLDQRALGGLWSAKTYLRELASPNSCLRILGKPLEDIHDPNGKPSKDAIEAMAPGPGTAGPGVATSGLAEAMTIIGLGCYWEIVDEAHITVLAVDPRYQRRGLGCWLLIHLLEDAYRRRLQRATLEVRASNSRAISLYEAFGFEILGNRNRYYPDGEDALILWQNALKGVDFRKQLTDKRAMTQDRLNAQGWQIMDTPIPVDRTVI